MDQSCSLLNKKCIPCEGGVPPLRAERIQTLLAEISGWSVYDNTRLVKYVTCKNFRDVMDVVNAIAALAELEGHHPDMNIHNWNKIDITLSTHAIGGLSENDFILAAKIDTILDSKNLR